MNSILLLAWRYMRFNRLTSIIIVTCVTITLSLPIAVYVLVHFYNNELTKRADTTPLIIGSRGNRYDLVLKSLYFNAERPGPVSMAEVEDIFESGLGLPVPLYIRYTARKFPIVGTSLEYFDFRNLKVIQGTLPLILGDAVVGSRVAQKLRLKPGSRLVSDQEYLYDISTTYPLDMNVTGVLAETGTPDDEAVFVDVKTAWVIEGIIHGHMDVTKTTDKSVIMESSDSNVVTNASIVEYQRITPKNIDSFHIHGGPENFPLTSVIVIPDNSKSATILRGRYKVKKMEQMLVPEKVIEELMGIVFKVKRFFDLNFALITISTILFLILVVLLSLRIRKKEMETLHKIGCSRMTVFWLQSAELGIVLSISLALSGLFSFAIVQVAPKFIKSFL